MEGSAAARGEGSSEEKNETAPPGESATTHSPPISSAISDEERKDYEERDNSLAIRQDNSAAMIRTARSTETEPSLEEMVSMTRVTMSANAESRQRLDGIPTTQVEVTPNGERSLNDGSG
jgi:hypothetical protein